MNVIKEEIIIRGERIKVDSVHVNDQTVILSDKFIKTARVKDEWYEDVKDPESIMNALKDAKVKADIFTFWQRIPEGKPKYDYYLEWENIAAIPVKGYDYWWTNQINSKTRNMVRKPEKRGVVIKEVEFNDELVRGIMNIFNESPVKRGKTFWHYGKDFETVKNEMSDVLNKSIFIGAYYKKHLIGFIKLICTDRYAMITVILDMIKHRDKSPINGLIAKVVEICDKINIPYITYTVWRRGGHGDFQRRNGFEKISVPRYFCPLTIKGRIALGLKLHHGFTGILPYKLTTFLLDLRRKVNSDKIHLIRKKNV